MVQRQNYDWLFVFAIVIVLVALVSSEIQAFGGDNNSVVAIIAAIGGLLSNIAASRFEQKSHLVAKGTLNAWVVGIVTGAALYVMLNAIIFTVGLVLVSEEAQFVQRDAAFVSDRSHFGEYVVLSASSVAALFVSVLSVVAGAALVVRSKNHLTSTTVASLSYVGISLAIRLASLLHGDIAQFKMFEEIGWGDVFIGLLMNLSIVSSMLWLGVVLVRGRNA
jgi:hypothetical protein